ncbi:MAG: ATP-binding protein [Sandaracinaceae bacterium]
MRPWRHRQDCDGPDARGDWHRRHRLRWRWHHRNKGLQRRIFLWFGATIVFTAFVMGMLFRLLSPTEQIQRDADGFGRFVSGRMEEVWDNPPARDRFLGDLHRDLHMDATLYDARERVIGRAGERCVEPWGDVPLTRRDGARMGRLVVCGPTPAFGGWRFFVILGVALIILWGASGILARRLFRPLRRLERMARRVAEGDLEVRAGMTPEQYGEVGVLGQTMDEMVARIETQLADQRELLAAVSHELRTPLAHLRVLVEMARDNPESKLLDDVEDELKEIDALVGQLLASSRVDFGRLDTQVVDAVQLAARALERADLGVETLEVEGTPRPIEVDPTLVARALANLLGNAAQHGEGVRRLVLRFNEQVTFAVEDAGPGFTEEDRAHVFEAFYRGEHRAGGSLGLGLSLVARIAEAHGGEPWIEDVEGGGARVGFSLSLDGNASA